MNRREFMKTCAAGVGGYVLSNRGIDVHLGRPSPNLLVIHTDQQSRWSLGAYGCTEIATPHVDSLAAGGALFTNFFNNHAVCTASRGCLQTGRYPHAHGAWTNNIELNRDEVTFAMVLRENGYATGYSGKWHIDGPPKPGWMTVDRSMGYTDCKYMFSRGHWKQLEDTPSGPQVKARDENDNPTYDVEGAGEISFTTDFLATKTIDFLNAHRDEPFCYMVSIPDPHGPRTVRPDYDTMYDPADMLVPSTLEQADEDKPNWASGNAAKGDTPEARAAWIQQERTQYYGMVKCIDDNVGRIVQALKDNGQFDNTIIVYTTDHGEFMGEHGLMNKGKPYDTAYHIPFIMCWPNGINAGTVVDNVVSNVDFLPTILGLMGYQSSGREQGNDGSGLLKGRIAGWKDESFIHHRPTGCLGIYTREYVLCYVNGKDHILFDRKNDPDEINNLFGNPAYQDVIDELTARLIEHNIEVGNPEVQWLEQIVA